MQPSSNGCPTSRSDGDVVRHDPRGLSVCTCRRSTCCKVQLKKARLRVWMGRTEARRKTSSDRTEKGGRRRDTIGSRFQLQINGRRSVSPIARRIKPKRNDRRSKRSTTSSSVQSATPPTSVHCDHSIALCREHHSEAETFVIGHKPRLFAASSSATIARSRHRASVGGRALARIATPYFTGQRDHPCAYHNRPRADAGVFIELFSADGLTSSASDLKTMNYRMKGCSISSTRGCNPMTIRR